MGQHGHTDDANVIGRNDAPPCSGRSASEARRKGPGPGTPVVITDDGEVVPALLPTVDGGASTAGSGTRGVPATERVTTRSADSTETVGDSAADVGDGVA
jgi:hypothetical protein